MSDIVERLRTENTLTGYYDPPQLQEKAAAEIERLRAEIVLLEATGAEAADEIERLRACVVAARREGIEAALAAVDAEPDPEGEMPAKLANTDKRILVLATVRATKRGIDGRIRALLTEGGR